MSDRSESHDETVRVSDRGQSYFERKELHKQNPQLDAAEARQILRLRAATPKPNPHE